MQLPIKQIRTFCQPWQIIEFAVFGSFLREDFGADSDLDVLVTFAEDTKWTLLDLVRMEQELEKIFQRSVDLIEKRGIEHSQNWIRRDEVLKTAVPVPIQFRRARSFWLLLGSKMLPLLLNCCFLFGITIIPFRSTGATIRSPLTPLNKGGIKGGIKNITIQEKTQGIKYR